MTPPLARVSIPGLFITGTDTGVGKTMIAGAIADWFRRQPARVAVLKPIATGCEHRREGLVSEDAEFLAHCADAPFPLDVICPVRYAEPLAPSVAADRAGVPIDWHAVQRSIDAMSKVSDVLIVEGVGGVMVPLDDQHTVLDLAQWLGLPAVVVARPQLGTINHTLLTVDALRRCGTTVLGVVINQFPTDTPTLAEELNPHVIAKWAKIPVVAIVQNEATEAARLPAGIRESIGRVDWQSLLRA